MSTLHESWKFYDYFTDWESLRVCLSGPDIMPNLVNDPSFAFLNGTEKLRFGENGLKSAADFLVAMTANQSNMWRDKFIVYLLSHRMEQFVQDDKKQMYAAQVSSSAPPTTFPTPPSLIVPNDYIFWVCAALTEFEEAKNVLRAINNGIRISFIPDPVPHSLAHVTLNGISFDLILLLPATQGGMSLTAALTSALYSLKNRGGNLRAVVSSGVCGGRKQENVLRGDVCVAQLAMDSRTGGKMDANGFQHLTNQGYPHCGPSWQHILGEPKMWVRNNDGTTQPARTEEDGQAAASWTPKYHFGAFDSDTHVKAFDGAFGPAVHINRKTIAIDMEAFAFYKTIEGHIHNTIPSLLVKGVVDYADGRKGDSFHKYANDKACRYLYEILGVYFSSINNCQ